MKKIVCEMCDSTEFVKEDGLFVCQECGCKYSVAEARKLMVEVSEEPETEAPEEENEDPRLGYPLHTSASPNRISIEVHKVGHETYTMKSVTSLNALFGEPEPEFVEGPDQVGHIGTEISVNNLAGNTIKYICVYLKPYNSVGDAVGCTVQGHSTFGINITGPIEVGDTWRGYSEGMWYNHSIVGAAVEYATVEYMDGTKELFEAEALLSQEESNESVSVVTVYYKSTGGAAGALWYTIDDSEKFTLMSGFKNDHYLEPGRHILSIKNPFVKKEYAFDLAADKSIRVLGKAFGMDVSEE